MRLRDFAAAALLLGPLVACGGSKEPGPGPGPSPSVTSIAISPGTDMLKIKGTENYVATAAYSNGTTATVTPTWRSDNPAVLTIEGGGRATANASGTATIIAEHEGRSGTKLVRVVPDYGGSWRGYMSLRNCQGDGAWAAGCAEIAPGDLDTISMAVTQQGAGITATLDLGGFAGPVTGSIAMDGALSVTGTYSTTMDGFPIDIAVVEWQTMSTDNARMTGRASFTMRSSVAPGQARLDFDLLNVSKSTTLNAPRDAGGELARAFRRVIRR